ncbi:MAG: type II toxin-antitoxin system RelE/ParE family toxin [Rhodanobacteraceae bacterium]
MEAQTWYETRAAGLGSKFARSVDAAVRQALRTPLAYAAIDKEFRHVLLRRFPYSIIYHVDDPELVVVSCFHHRRRPGSWHRK